MVMPLFSLYIIQVNSRGARARVQNADFLWGTKCAIVCAKDLNGILLLGKSSWGLNYYNLFFYLKYMSPVSPVVVLRDKQRMMTSIL